MKKVYILLGLCAVITLISCDNSDTSTEGTSGEDLTDTEAGSTFAATETLGDSTVMEAYKNDKSTISSADLDKDSTFTTRTKRLYFSDENGRKMAVVYGFKETNTGVAIVEVEGEKSIKLKQIETTPGAPYEFTNGTVTLKKIDKTAELNENGEIVIYKEIL